MLITLPIFLVALVAIIVPMYRGVTHRADARLRAQFEAQSPGSEVSRRLMHDAGYNV